MQASASHDSLENPFDLCFLPLVNAGAGKSAGLQKGYMLTVL